MHTPDHDAEDVAALMPLAAGGIGDGLDGEVGREVTEQRGQPGPRAGTSAFDGAFGDTKQAGGVGDGVTLHVDRDHRGALLDG